MSDQYEKLLEEQAKEKQKVPTVWISKSWKVNWDDAVVKLFKKLFRR